MFAWVVVANKSSQTLLQDASFLTRSPTYTVTSGTSKSPRPPSTKGEVSEFPFDEGDTGDFVVSSHINGFLERVVSKKQNTGSSWKGATSVMTEKFPLPMATSAL